MNLHPNLHPLVQLVYKTMEQRDLNVSQLEEISGVSRHTIRNWFVQGADPGITYLDLVLKALGIELEVRYTPLPIGVQKIRARQISRKRELGEELARRNRLGLRGTKHALSVAETRDLDPGDEGIWADVISELAKSDTGRVGRDEFA
jgi:transcriptional regulator with XRE-family HTH domain